MSRPRGRAPCVIWSKARRFLVRFLNTGKGLVGEAGLLIALRVGQTRAFTIEHQLGVIDQRHALLGGKVLRVAANEVDMRTLFEDETRGVDGIAQPLDAGHTARAHGAGDAAIHQQCIELDFAVAREKGAAACIERLVVFEHGDGGLDCIDSSGAALQQRVTGEQRTADAEGVSIDGVIRDGPRAAMNEKDRLIGHANSSSYMGDSEVLSPRGNWIPDYLHSECVDSVEDGIDRMLRGPVYKCAALPLRVEMTSGLV